jgi:hypothetical protein
MCKAGIVLTCRAGIVPTILLHFLHCTWTCRCRAAQDVRERPSLEVRCTNAADAGGDCSYNPFAFPPSMEVRCVGAALQSFCISSIAPATYRDVGRYDSREGGRLQGCRR